MPPTLSKDTFDAAKGYEKVILTVNGSLLDFDTNEAQDIARDARDRIVSQMAETAKLLGSSGQLKPAVSGLARMVDVVSGIAVSGGKVVRIPSATDLQVFANGTTTGIVSSVVYAAWWDTQLDYTGDAAIQPVDPSNFGNGNWRLKRNVQIRVVQGSTVLPAPGAGETFIQLGIVTHDFTANAIVQSGDVAQDPYGLTPGELAGYGAARPLRLGSNAQNTETGFSFDTRTVRTTGALFKLKDAGVTKVWGDKDGKLSLGTGLAPSEALDVAGNIKATGNLLPGGDITMSGVHTVDGVDVSAHTHDGTTIGGAKVTHSNLLGLSGDDHAQYVHLTAARTIVAAHTFNPAAPGVPFLLGANAVGQRVVGLNADQVDGKDLTDLAQLAAVQNITGAWTFKANVLADAAIRFDGVDLSTVADGAGGVAHANLSGLGGDDHTQYVHNTTARLITARHTFNPTAPNAPFILGANALGQLVAGLNAEQVGGQNLTALDTRYVNASGDTMSGVLTLGAALDFADSTVSISRVVNLLALAASGGFSFAGDVLLSNNLAVTGTSAFTGRAKFAGNLLDGGTASLAIVNSGSVQVDNVGKNALITYFKVDPGAYAGSYDVVIYQDNNTTSTLLAKWQGQTGIMEDRAPFYFKNVRTDERLYAQVTKATGGVSHTFTVALDAQRFA